MNIAVLFGEIGFISRYKIIEGIRDRAVRDKANIVLYTCEGFLYEELKDYIAGEYNIFDLPALENYDGVIVDLDSIQNHQTAEMVKNKIEEANIPCISFNQIINNADVIRFDNESGFKKMLEHLIQEHGVQNIVYMSGPKGNRDAEQRKDVFLNVMRENGIEITDDCMYYGDFNFESGRQMIRDYLVAGKELPQAFVAANDYMAIGLMEGLRKAGISVPKRVIITGYDNCDLANLTIPRLSTVDRGEFAAGQLAYDRLINKIKGEKENGFCIVEGKPIFADSCGCTMLDKQKINSNTYVDMQINMDRNLDLLKGLSIEFSNMDTLEKFEQSMEKYISRMGMEFFYFCQCGSRESYYDDLEVWASGRNVKHDITKFQSLAWCPIAYEDGEWRSYSSFDIRNLFPPDSQYKKENSCYIVMPVHQGKVCIGYSIVGNFHENFSGRVIQHLVLNIDQAIGNIRKQDIMRTMLAKINQKWQYDELTGLYNRSGMWNKSERLIENAVKQNMGVALFFFDLDGLKKINDTKGHEAGDQYIKLMADMLLAGKKDDDVMVRYGGDEYIVISKQPTEEAGRKKFQDIISYIKEPISVSAGYVFRKISSLSELKPLIEEADRRMYDNKKDRKIARR